MIEKKKLNFPLNPWWLIYLGKLPLMKNQEILLILKNFYFTIYLLNISENSIPCLINNIEKINLLNIKNEKNKIEIIKNCSSIILENNFKVYIELCIDNKVKEAY